MAEKFFQHRPFIPTTTRLEGLFSEPHLPLDVARIGTKLFLEQFFGGNACRNIGKVPCIVTRHEVTEVGIHVAAPWALNETKARI